MDKYISFIKNNNLGLVIENSSFANITTFRVGGKIKLLFLPDSYEKFIIFYKNYLLDECPPEILIVGNGSNILASDNDYNGIVVSFKNIENNIELKKDNEKYIVTCYSNVTLTSLSKFLMNNSITGGEFFHFIPGLVGGSICMNASSYGKDMSSIVNRVYCIDESGNEFWITKENLEFGYRESVIKKKKYIIIKAEFIFQGLCDKNEIANTINQFKKRKVETQPINYPSAGSVFKNKDNKKAWQIIDELGFRGKCLGDCCVSYKHSNFIINKGKAKASDIYSLMNIIKKVYKDSYNDELECEWILVNF